MQGGRVDIWPVLSDDQLDGSYPIDRVMSPRTHCRLIRHDRLEDGVEFVRDACGRWAGAVFSMIPVVGGELSDEWADVLGRSAHQRVHSNGLVADDQESEERWGGGSWSGGPHFGELLVSVLARVEKSRWDWDLVHVADAVDPGDPWYVSYVGTLGLSPRLTSDDLRGSGLRPDLTYADLVNYRSPEDVRPGGADLLARLRQEGSTTAPRLTAIGSALLSAGVNRGFRSSWQTEPPLSGIRHRNSNSADIGSNVVVVYEPGSVEDLALLWQLRATHGLPAGFPLAVPATDDVAQVLETWIDQGAPAQFGFGTPREWRLVSCSVDEPRLLEIRRRLGKFSVGPLGDVLRAAPGMGVTSHETAHFEQGLARLAPFTATDREVAGPVLLQTRSSEVEVTVAVSGRSLPFSRTMRRDEFLNYREGPVVHPSPNEAVTVAYPTGLDVLHAILNDRGLTCRPSRPGRAAEHLFRRLNGLSDLHLIASEPAIELLSTLTRRRGTRWLRRTLRAVLGMEAQASAEIDRPLTSRLELLEHRLSLETQSSDLDDLNSVSFSDIVRTIGTKPAAEAWLRWALDAGILVRGVRAACSSCGKRQWLEFSALTAEVECNGCGLGMGDPFPPTAVQFLFRASDVLVQAMELDVLPHVLTLNYFCRYLRPIKDAPSQLFGAYPGIEIRELGSERLLGECDVVFVMDDGGLVIAECKSSAAGITSEEISKAEALAGRIGAGLTLFCSLDSSQSWTDAQFAAMGEFSIALAREHLLDPFPRHTLAHHPLEWRSSHHLGNSPATTDEHAQAFRARVLRSAVPASRRRVPWRSD